MMTKRTNRKAGGDDQESGAEDSDAEDSNEPEGVQSPLLDIEGIVTEVKEKLTAEIQASETVDLAALAGAVSQAVAPQQAQAAALPNPEGTGAKKMWNRIVQRVCKGVSAMLVTSGKPGQSNPAAVVEAGVEQDINTVCRERQLENVRVFFVRVLIAVIRAKAGAIVESQTMVGVAMAVTAYTEGQAISTGTARAGTVFLLTAYLQRKALGAAPEINQGAIARALAVVNRSGSGHSTPGISAGAHPELAPWLPYNQLTEDSIPAGVRVDTLQFSELGYMQTLPPGAYVFIGYSIAVLITKEQDGSQSYYVYVLGQDDYIKTRFANVAEAIVLIFSRIFTKPFDGRAEFVSIVEGIDNRVFGTVMRQGNRY